MWILYRAITRPLGRWCHVGDHPLRNADVIQLKDTAKRQRLEMLLQCMDPYKPTKTTDSVKQNSAPRL